MKSVCFTRHRNIPDKKTVLLRLNEVLKRLIDGGATDFYAGGAKGSDTLAAQTVLQLRALHPQIKLHLILPCGREDQTAKWFAADIAGYDRILAAADSAEFISERYFRGCMRARNERLAELADCLVCCYNNKNSASGTGQTIRMAERRNIRVINLAGADIN